MQEMIAPHGGVLIDRVLTGSEHESWQQRAANFPKLVVSQLTVSDLLCMATGVFSPLTGFMNQADYQSVLQEMRLAGGEIWTLPIVLPVPAERVAELERATHVTLYSPQQQALAVMELENLYEANLTIEAQQIFGTTDPAHPGVARLATQSAVYAGGQIWLLQKPQQDRFATYAHTPAEMRQWFSDQSWRKIVGFQTRNPIHRAHEYIQKAALETVDGLFLHPLVGETKADDIPAEIRMKSYEVLLKRYYPQDRVKLAVFPASMRYAGPREAVFHALVRKNYGCTHFIVGRDHAGVGNFYGTYEAQQIFAQFPAVDLGITPLFFEHSFYCTVCEGMASLKTCPHHADDHIALSGTKVRKMLKDGRMPPAQFTRPEVAQILIDGMKAKVNQ